MNNEKISKFIACVVVVYIGVWLWPVFFHQRLFYPQGCEFNCFYGGAIPTPYSYSKDSEIYINSGIEKTEDEYPVQITIDGSATNSDNVACPADAKLCDDGSSVGRVGPNCDFEECPQIQ